MTNNYLIDAISKLIPKNESLIEIIANILDISYASAHRRTNNSSKFSIDEAVTLARHFNISLDFIFNTGNKNIIPVEKTQISIQPDEIEAYFLNSEKLLKTTLKLENSFIIYCSKDLPVAHVYSQSNLARFKIYVWKQLLDPNFKTKKYSEYIITKNVTKRYNNAVELYSKSNTIEIWDVTTLNSTLKQILYFNSINFLTNKDALIVCEELKKTIFDLRKKTTPESNHKLYSNELLLMGNKMLVKTPNSSSLLIQYTAINYFKTSDKDTCDHTYEYLMRILKNCTLINTATEKEKDFFFNKMIDKVSSLSEHIIGKKNLDF